MNKIYPSSHYAVRYARDNDRGTLLAARCMSEAHEEYEFIDEELDLMLAVGSHPYVNQPLCYEDVSVFGERVGIMLYPLAYGGLDTFLVGGAVFPVGYLKDPDTVISQLAAGLRAIHSAGVVHRDLKPANILVFDRCLKLTDFSSAAYADSCRGPDVFTRKVLPYSAPEELMYHENEDEVLEPFEDEDYDLMSVQGAPDMYALGIICLHYLVAPDNALVGIDGAHRRYEQGMKTSMALGVSLLETAITQDARIALTHVEKETDFSELFFSVFPDQRLGIAQHPFSVIIEGSKRAGLTVSGAAITGVANMLRLSPQHRHL